MLADNEPDPGAQTAGSTKPPTAPPSAQTTPQVAERAVPPAPAGDEAQDTSGRPPLAEIAASRVADRHTRTVGDDGEEN